jgi:hypothetical protein
VQDYFVLQAVQVAASCMLIGPSRIAALSNVAVDAMLIGHWGGSFVQVKGYRAGLRG